MSSSVSRASRIIEPEKSFFNSGYGLPGKHKDKFKLNNLQHFELHGVNLIVEVVRQFYWHKNKIDEYIDKYWSCNWTILLISCLRWFPLIAWAGFVFDLDLPEVKQSVYLKFE